MLIWSLLLGAIWSQKLEFERKKVFWRSGFDREHEVKNKDFKVKVLTYKIIDIQNSNSNRL